jgi:biotin operon repressor
MIDRYARQIEPAGVAVYCLLARLADADGRCFPSLTYIGETLGLSRVTVIKYLGKLEVYGLIEMLNRETLTGKIQSNAYRLLPAKPDPTSSEFEPVTSSENGPVQILTPNRHETSSNSEPLAEGALVQNLTPTSSNSEPYSTLEDSTRESKNAAVAKNPMRARANGGGFEEIRPDEEAAAALLKADPNAVYRWIGRALLKPEREDWLTQVGAHFAAGHTVTVAHLAAAREQAERDFHERSNGQRRTMGWFYTALKEVLNPAEDPPEPLTETREQWEKRWRIVFHPERRAECLAELVAAAGNPEATEKAREHLRFALRLNGFMGAEIEEEAAEVEAAAREEVAV